MYFSQFRGLAVREQGASKVRLQPSSGWQAVAPLQGGKSKGAISGLFHEGTHPIHEGVFTRDLLTPKGPTSSYHHSGH